jgi:hypothetical protein
VALFKTPEEKEAERRAREAEQERERAAAAERVRLETETREKQAWLASPVGAATSAREAGERFFEVQLPVGGHTGAASWGMASGTRSATSSAAALREIEDVGWRLEHASYFFMVTGESSTERMFLSGQETAVSGVTVGVYLFRRTDDPA